MTVKLPDYPGDGLAVLTTALADLDFGVEKRALGGATAQTISEPVPVFTLALSDAMRGAIPDGIAPTSWRYLLVDDDDLSVADVTSSENGAGVGEFSRITQGGAVQRFAYALALVDRLYAEASDEYEVRTLEIPSINEAAVWLRSTAGLGDLFVPYLDGPRLKGEPPAISESYLEDVSRAADAFDYGEDD